MIRIFLFVFLMISIPFNNFGFALLAHEAIIDATWEKSILPLLKFRFPNATEEELQQAHAYLYGGSIIPDIGYYPFGSKQFTNLVHYVRSGDFIENALRESHNLNEYAFSLGLLCHYNADKYGHPLGTNRAVALLFPKSRKKYGDVVTYEQERSQHARVEFGFDVLQTAKGNFNTKNKHDFIGFKVSSEVLERAVLKTYGLTLDDLFTSLPVAVETFRFTVKQLIPELTRDAWKVRKSIITEINPLAEKASYTEKFKRKSYFKEFGKLKFKSWFLTLFIGILPKVGPLSVLKFKEPRDETERLFESSFNAIVKNYSEDLSHLKSAKPKFQNINCDTGNKTLPGEYVLADKCHYNLIRDIYEEKFEFTDPELRDYLLKFYSTRTPSGSCLEKRRYKRKLVAPLADLKNDSTATNLKNAIQ